MINGKWSEPLSNKIHIHYKNQTHNSRSIHIFIETLSRYMCYHVGRCMYITQNYNYYVCDIIIFVYSIMPKICT